MDGKVFISRQSRHPFSLINNMIKVLFRICTLIWRVNNYVFRQGKGINDRNEIIELQPLGLLLALCSTDDFNQENYFRHYKDCKQQFDFSSGKTVK